MKDLTWSWVVDYDSHIDDKSYMFEDVKAWVLVYKDAKDSLIAYERISWS